jgi:hypothetical protein
MHINIHTYIHICTHVYPYMHICTYAHMHIHTNTHKYLLCKTLCQSLDGLYICDIYTYVYPHTTTHTHTHNHTQPHTTTRINTCSVRRFVSLLMASSLSLPSAMLKLFSCNMYVCMHVCMCVYIDINAVFAECNAQAILL